MTTLIVWAILLAVICIVELWFVAVRYEKLKQKTTMRQIFHQDMQCLSKWVANNWFKLAVVGLFVIFICILQAGLNNINTRLKFVNSNLGDIETELGGIKSELVDIDVTLLTK